MKNHIDIGGRPLQLLLCFLILSSTLPAQTLFTCDGRSVSKDDFLKAYNKNNTGEKASEKSYREYLDLYIRYKLKVKAAYDMQLDTLPGQRVELQNFRAQVADSYLKDEASMDKLIQEVYARGQKDIHLAHIFIAQASPTDSSGAYMKASIAYNALKKGKRFAEAAQQWSEDPSAKTNGGDIGYITVFTLPYELETLAYSTPAGQLSPIYHSKGGYHIFKNLGERKDPGRMRAAQILLSVPPGATINVREEARQRADSIYTALQRGADFGQLARSFSGDNLSYQSGGEIPEFSVGRYDSAFEAAAFALERDGAVSRPVATAYGYHIIKRLGKKIFPQTLDETTLAEIKQAVNNDARVEVSRQALLKKIYQQTNMRRMEFSMSDLSGFADSLMTNPTLSQYRTLSYSNILFAFPEQQYAVQNFLDYARNIKTSGRATKISNQALYEQFVGRTAMDYYRNHLEQYNREFAFQLNEFKEGNLLFEVMQRKVWDKASTDSAGLYNFYEGHKDKYWWESSVDALLFTCSNEQAGQRLRTQLAGNPSDWRRWSDSSGSGVQADSGRYELAQIPSLEKASPVVHQLTPMLTNPSDHSVSFAYILNVYPQRTPRNYRDARGFVINDYQNYLEDEWIAALRKKYPVTVDEKVLASLPK